MKCNRKLPIFIEAVKLQPPNKTKNIKTWTLETKICMCKNFTLQTFSMATDGLNFNETETQRCRYNFRSYKYGKCTPLLSKWTWKLNQRNYEQCNHLLGKVKDYTNTGTQMNFKYCWVCIFKQNQIKSTCMFSNGCLEFITRT